MHDDKTNKQKKTKKSFETKQWAISMQKPSMSLPVSQKFSLKAIMLHLKQPQHRSQQVVQPVARQAYQQFVQQASL